MDVPLSDKKLELINSIAKNQGFDDFKIYVKSESMKGDGYLGIINIILIQDTHNSENKLNLIIKSALTDEKLRESVNMKKVYNREIFLYGTILPELSRFSDEVGIAHKFTETARYFGNLFDEKEECIVLENLKEINFKLWNRKLPMDFDHVALVFMTYAKFHATGIALKLLRPEKYKDLTKDLKNIMEKDEQTEEEIKGIEKIITNGFEAVANNEKATKALQRIVANLEKLFKEDIKRIDKYSTILHGDCWCNNMMFKYNDTVEESKPTEMCLLDWQISHVGSPILDLSYFLYACSSKEVLYNFKTLLKIYHEAFNNTLREAGVSPDLWTCEELEEQWKIYSGYGFFMALFVMRAILSDPEETPDLSKLLGEGKDILQCFGETNSSNIEAVNRRISDIIEFIDEFGFA